MRQDTGALLLDQQTIPVCIRMYSNMLLQGVDLKIHLFPSDYPGMLLHGWGNILFQAVLGSNSRGKELGVWVCSFEINGFLSQEQHT